jgi:hypothetical protein
MFAFLEVGQQAVAKQHFQNEVGYLDGGHDVFCDSITTYAMITIPIIAKIAGTICAQIWDTCAPHPKSTNISKSAITATTAAIRQIVIDLNFLEFPITFSSITSVAFKFN